MTYSEVVIVAENAELGQDGDIVDSGLRATPVQIGAVVGFAALIAVILALVLVASRR